MCASRLAPQRSNMACKERRTSPLFRPWDAPLERRAEEPVGKVLQPEPLYLIPQQPVFPAVLTAGCCLPWDEAVLEQEAARWKAKKQRPKRFQCPHCGVSFSNNGQLKGHIRIHTGERPFACEYEGCGKTFTRNEELTRHKRIHTGLRPYPCPLCQKPFGRKDHLKKHVKTHQRAFLPPPPGLPYFFEAPPYLFVG